MLRVVIDTNIVISGLNLGANPKAVLELARKNRIHNTTFPFIINEVEKVLRGSSAGKWWGAPGSAQ